MANTVISAAGYSGTRSTVGITQKAGINLTAVKGHTYYVVIDGTTAGEATGADFDLQVVGKTGGAGCM